MSEYHSLYDFRIEKWEETLKKWKKSKSEKYDKWMNSKHLYKIDSVVIQDLRDQLIRDFYSTDTWVYRKCKGVFVTLKDSTLQYYFQIYFSPDQNQWVTTDLSARHREIGICPVCKFFNRYTETEGDYGDWCILDTFELKYLFDQIKKRPEHRLRLLLNK